MSFVSILFYLVSSLLYYDYNNTHFSDRFVSSLTPGSKIPGIIGHKDLVHISTSNHMNCGGKGF